MENKYPSIKVDALKNITTIAGKTNISFLEKILNTYLSGTPESLQKLQTAFDNKNQYDIGSVAHALKSNSALVGALGLQALFLDLEKLSKNSTSFAEAESKALITKIQEEYKKVSQDLLIYLKDIKS